MDGISIKDTEILDLLQEDLNNAKDFASERSDRRKEDYKVFRAAAYPGDDDRKRKGWSTTVNSVVANSVNWTMPGLVEIFTDDFFAFKLGDVEQAEALKKYMRKLMFKQQDGEGKTDAFIQDSLIYRDGGLFKVYFKQEYDLETEKYDRLSAEEFSSLQADPAVTVSKYTEEEYSRPVFDAWGQPMVDGWGQAVVESVNSFKNVKAVRKVITFMGPALEVIPPDEFFITSEAKDIDGARLCYHETDRNLHYIRKREKAGVYRKGSYSKVKEALSNDEGSPDVDQERTERLELEGLTDISQETSSSHPELEPSTKVKVREIYTSMDIDGDGLLEKVIVWEACGVILQVMENPYKRPPFRRSKPFPLNHQWSQDPYPSQLGDDQRLITNMDRLAQDSAALSTYTNPITNDPQLFKALLNRGPHTVLQGDPQRIGDAAPRGGRSQFILKVKEDAVGAVENKSGITRYNQGLDANSLNKTLGGMSMIMTASQQRQRLIARRLGWTMKEVIADFLSILSTWPTQEYQQIMQGRPVRLEDIEINVGVSFNEKYQAAMMLESLIQWQSTVGLQVGVPPEKTMATIKRKFQLLGIKVDDFLPSPEEANGMRQANAKVQQLTKKLEEKEAELRAEKQRADAAGRARPDGGGSLKQPMGQGMDRGPARPVQGSISGFGPMGFQGVR